VSLQKGGTAKATP